MSSAVTMYSPFHPHASQTLPVVSSPRHTDGSYTVQAPAGCTLQVPVWMTEPTAANSRRSPSLSLSIAALKAVEERLSRPG